MYSVEFPKVHAINEGRFLHAISQPLKNKRKSGTGLRDAERESSQQESHFQHPEQDTIKR